MTAKRVKQEADVRTTVHQPQQAFPGNRPMPQDHPNSNDLANIQSYADNNAFDVADSIETGTYGPVQPSFQQQSNFQASLSPRQAVQVFQAQSETPPAGPSTPRGKRGKVTKGQRKAQRAQSPILMDRDTQAQRDGRERIPIERLARPTIINPLGPMSRQRDLPPLPKPGRKPGENGADKPRRRAQNCDAQTRHRNKLKQARKAQEAELEYKRQEIQKKDCELQKEREANAKMKQLLDARYHQAALGNGMDAQRHTYTRHDSTGSESDVSMMADMSAQHQFQRQGPIVEKSVTMPLTPPENNTYEETDFTNFDRTVHLGSTHHSNDLGPSGLGDDRCGFCTDAQNCLCKQDSGPEPELQPGNCAGCLADPQQDQACRQLAASATTSNPFPTFRTWNTNTDTPMRSDSPMMTRISCQQLMDRTKNSGQRLASITELFGDSIHAHPSSDGRIEVEEREAAEALQALAARDAARDIR